MYRKIISSFAILALTQNTLSFSIDKPASANVALLSPDEPGQAAYRVALRDAITTAIDALLFSPLPAEIDFKSDKNYRESFNGQQQVTAWSKELMYGIIEELRSGFVPVDSASAADMHKDLYRTVEEGSEQFSQALYKTIAAINAAEVALAAPAAGIRRALERRGYIVVDEASFRNVDGNSTGNSTDGEKPNKSSYTPYLQTAGNVLDLSKCVKDSMTGHYDHINVFEVIPVVGPMLTHMPGAGMVLEMINEKIKPFKRYAYAASCIKELGDTQWGPNDDEVLSGQDSSPLTIASALCNAIYSADGAVKSLFSTATGVGMVGYSVANAVVDGAVGAVPFFGKKAVGLKHGVQQAAGNMLSTGANVVKGLGNTARNGLAQGYLG